MARRSRHSAYHALVQAGPWVPGSAHGYHAKKKTKECFACEDWRHTDRGKYGQGYEHCQFCKEDIPFHKEYCPWYDFFQAWDQPNPMGVENDYDKNIPKKCEHPVVSEA